MVEREKTKVMATKVRKVRKEISLFGEKIDGGDIRNNIDSD